MSKINRHDWSACGDMEKADDGEYVKHSDYAELWENYHMSKATINNRESIIKKLEADYAELEKKYQNDPATIQLLDCTDRCLELEESAELRLHIGQEYKERMIKAEEQRDELQKQRDKLYESNNRQSDIIYDLKVERDELIEFLNCIITRYDNDDSVSGIYLDKARNYLLQIKGEEL